MTDQYKFDPSTDEAIQAKIKMPDAWDRGTIKVKFYWDVDTSGSGTVTWGAKAGALSDNDAIDSALWGGAVTKTDTVITVGDLHISDATSALTVGGSPALDDLIWFEVYRDVSADSCAQDAKLLGVLIQYREDTSNSTAW